MDLKEKILVECYLSQTGLSHNQMVKDRLNLEIKNNEHDYALSAMYELSKIVAIAFAKWVDNNATQVSSGKWFSLPLQIKSNNPLSSESLYDLFTQSKEYKELMDEK